MRWAPPLMAVSAAFALSLAGLPPAHDRPSLVAGHFAAHPLPMLLPGWMAPAGPLRLAGGGACPGLGRPPADPAGEREPRHDARSRIAPILGVLKGWAESPLVQGWRRVVQATKRQPPAPAGCEAE